MNILLDTYTWFTFSFLLFAFIVYRYGGPVIITMLDKRIAEIKNDIETAENLRVEAQEMLAQYQRKQRDALKEAEKIIKDAKESAKKIQENAENELQESLERKEQQLTERLKRMEQNAIQEIQSYAANLAMNAASQIIAEKLDKNTNAKLVEQSIKNIGQNIH